MSDIDDLLQTERRRPWWRRAVFRITAILVTALLIGFVLWLTDDGHEATAWRTAEVERGGFTVEVTATGTLQPLNRVEVGSELSGTINRVLVDYNDQVSAGQVIAELDTVRLEAQVFQSRAGLASAEARLEEARATVIETELRFQRCEQLAARQLCAREELDTLRAAHARARAGEKSAEAEVAVARATMETVETDLSKAKIRSPIDGIVLKREIEPGQTVAASLQTPILFLLAEDLTRMRLHVYVDEADIGQVRAGQESHFSVDTWPGRSFPARIDQVRFSPQELEGTSVVSYETVLSVDNSELLLLPGMTATADIVVREVEDALLVPNAALRFTPPVTDAPQAASGNALTGLFMRGPRRPAGQRVVTDTPGAVRHVWVLQDGEPVQVPVTTGATDGRVTEIIDGAITPGTTLVIGVAVTAR